MCVSTNIIFTSGTNQTGITAEDVFYFAAYMLQAVCVVQVFYVSNYEMWILFGFLFLVLT